jgi:trans-aconitate 2-methyltransferase
MGLYTEFVADWDAHTYHRVSDPQRNWGLRVLQRLAPAAGECILDIGCGTGRLTSEIVRLGPRRVVGLDRSSSMLMEANRSFGAEIHFVHADATDLPFRSATFDSVFSTATFHWVPDHPRLFAEIHRVLRPGGRLVSQAGGGPNLARLYARCDSLRRHETVAHLFEGWGDPWTFAGVDDTRTRVQAAGFKNIDVSLEPAPTTFSAAPEYAEFVSTVCLRHHLERLSPDQRQEFVHRITEMAAADDPPFTLDYWRLNIDARK